MKDPIYLLHHKLKWKTFKLLHDRCVKDDGPTPVNMTKTLWEMMRDKQIYCWYDTEHQGDMGVGIKPPKKYSIVIKDHDYMPKVQK